MSAVWQAFLDFANLSPANGVWFILLVLVLPVLVYAWGVFADWRWRRSLGLDTHLPWHRRRKR